MKTLNENEAPKGYKAEESTDGCKGCAFHDADADQGCTNPGAKCVKFQRKDECNVIFKKIDPWIRLEYNNLEELKETSPLPTAGRKYWFAWRIGNRSVMYLIGTFSGTGQSKKCLQDCCFITSASKYHIYDESNGVLGYIEIPHPPEFIQE